MHAQAHPDVNAVVTTVGAAVGANPAHAVATPAPGAQATAHELRFDSLFHPGRGVTVPCDASGRVDMDTLTERLRNAYLAARAMVGRDYACPRVQPAY